MYAIITFFKRSFAQEMSEILFSNAFGVEICQNSQDWFSLFGEFFPSVHNINGIYTSKNSILLFILFYFISFYYEYK